MQDSNAVPFRWKIVTVLAVAVSVGLVVYIGVAVVRAVLDTSCHSDSRISSFCDPYLPNIPGKEGR